MTDNMDASETEKPPVDHAEIQAAAKRALKRKIGNWAKRWTLGMGLVLVVALFLERARLLPLLTSIFALLSLATLLIRHKIATRKNPPT